MTASPTEKTTSGWVPEVDTFAKRLVLVRLGMGWHNADAASREYGLPKESYRDWEKGKYVPRNLLDVCAKIVGRTDVDFGWLYGGDAMRGQQPSAEALQWLRMDSDHLAKPRTNAPLLSLTEQPMAGGRPRDRRPPGRTLTGNTSPGPARPARLARPANRRP